MADWTWHQGAIAGCSGRGAIAGCHCSVLWLGGDDQLWGSGRGAIAGCNCSVLWWGEEGDGQLWGSGRGAIAAGHPLLGANLCFICSFYFQGRQFHPDTQEIGNEFCLGLLADVTVFPTLLTQILVCAIWGL